MDGAGDEGLRGASREDPARGDPQGPKSTLVTQLAFRPMLAFGVQRPLIFRSQAPGEQGREVIEDEGKKKKLKGQMTRSKGLAAPQVVLSTAAEERGGGPLGLSRRCNQGPRQADSAVTRHRTENQVTARCAFFFFLPTFKRLRSNIYKIYHFNRF